MNNTHFSISGNKDNRIFWLDAARVFAIISVTFNHSINRTFDMHVNTAAEFMAMPISLTIFKASIQILSRIGVPIFLMITGTLLLNRDYTSEGKAERFYKHNWLSLFITAEIWYLLIFLYKSMAPDSILRTKGIASTVKQLFMNQLFINQDTFSSMWYMAMILCVYLIIPFVAVGLQKIKTKWLLVPFGIALASAFILPNADKALGLIFGYSKEGYIHFNLSIANLFSLYLIYILIGYWINKGGLAKMPGYLVVLVAALAFILTSAYQVWAFSRPGNYVVGYESTGVLITAMFLFECFRRYGYKLNSLSAIIVPLSNISFGIYFVHVCIMEGLQIFVPKSVGHIPYFVILELGSFIGSIIIIQLLRRSKRLSKLLFRV